MERLQKVIAQAGVASRRKAEILISEGKVAVNGVIVTELGTKVKRGDQISVEGKTIVRENKVYFIMNKPKKCVCTNEENEDRLRAIDLIACEERIFTVGRLDYDTSGVLLLTNDGEFANLVTHPRHHIPKIYNLTINGVLSSEDIRKIKSGIVLDDGMKTLPAKIKHITYEKEKCQTTFDLTIVEGRNRQVKRMMEALGYQVRRLHRKQLAFLSVSDLSQGDYRNLKPFEIKKLKALASEGTYEHLILE
ncbi:rRNA pseudouridine synthase [bacterium c-19]|nr:rRNA pseudouridine synthase [bacterium c-19]